MNAPCRRPRARRGTTLIEVIVGLVILATLLVSVSIARGRFARQWTDADRRLRLAHAADTLLTEWMAGPAQAVPVNRSGKVDGGVAWTTTARPDANAAAIGALVVRLDVTDPQAGAAEAFTVDFVLHDTRQASGGTGER